MNHNVNCPKPYDNVYMCEHKLSPLSPPSEQGWHMLLHVNLRILGGIYPETLHKHQSLEKIPKR